RITLSTVGLVPEIARMGREMPINLAVSLHAADDETRSAIMPINRKYPLRELMRTLRAYPLPPRQRITFEYVLLSGVNDRPEDAHRLARLIRGIRAKVNLIPMNEHPGSVHRRPPPSRVEAFREILQSYHLTVTLRATRGDDIAAACGQLQGASPSSPPVRVPER
ncbi:MAG: 23S rRNA (adenine(2503)-C(2))-methyltransferase RlmN, partial [Deltaproteobacteria bacterium]